MPSTLSDTAILLIGGDKTGEWNEWYKRTVPVADNLFADHLRALAEQGVKDKDTPDKKGKRGRKR